MSHFLFFSIVNSPELGCHIQVEGNDKKNPDIKPRKSGMARDLKARSGGIFEYFLGTFIKNPCF